MHPRVEIAGPGMCVLSLHEAQRMGGEARGGRGADHSTLLMLEGGGSSSLGLEAFQLYVSRALAEQSSERLARARRKKFPVRGAAAHTNTCHAHTRTRGCTHQHVSRTHTRKHAIYVLRHTPDDKADQPRVISPRSCGSAEAGDWRARTDSRVPVDKHSRRERAVAHATCVVTYVPPI